MHCDVSGSNQEPRQIGYRIKFGPDAVCLQLVLAVWALRNRVHFAIRDDRLNPLGRSECCYRRRLQRYGRGVVARSSGFSVAISR